MSGKRANIFGQGRPETPYDERDEPSDVPQRATAAQLAARKIKSAKPRRAAGSSSVSSQSAGFGAPAGLNFGASAPAPSNGMTFGGSTAFGGGGANSSFPPAQSSAPSDSFVNSSFPAFGASTQSTGFNPQPPAAGFSFTAGNSNPFASTNGATPISSAPATNGFGGGGIFSSQAPSNPFGGLSQSNNTGASSSGGLFGTVSSAPSTNMFGTTSAAPNVSNASAPSPAPFTFGAPTSTSQNAASTPATTGIFSGFGASSQATAPPATNNIFSGFGTGTPKNDTPLEVTKPALFSSITSGQSSSGSVATAPSSSLFNFGTNAQKSDITLSATPSTNMFGASNTAMPSSNAASNPFGGLSTTVSSSSAPAPAPAFNFGQQATIPAQEKTPANPFSAIKLPESVAETPKPSLFSSIKTPQQVTPAPSETPKANPFASLSKPAPSANTSGFNFGGSQSKDKPNAAPAKAAEDPKPNFFGGFSTPQPTKSSGAEKSTTSLFSAQPKATTSMFSQGSQPDKSGANNVFKASSAQDGVKEASTAEKQNPFATLPASQTGLFAPKGTTAAPSPTASSMPNLTGGTSTSSTSAPTPELPQVPKAHVPKEWIAGSPANPQNVDGLFDLITSMVAELQGLNLRYREKLNSSSTAADWSSLSLWHFQHSSSLKKRIDNAKKQRATSKGITGYESSLSTKRKANEEQHEDRTASPSKRARPANSVPAPPAQPSTPTPKFNPPAPTATSNIFAKAINSQPAAPSDNVFSSSSAATETSKAATGSTGFKPSASAANGATGSSSLFSGGFKPTATATASNSSSGGFKPVAPASSSGGFASQFASKAKTYEELAAERKKKAKDADYDSDDETEAEWSARYDQEEAERLAKEKVDAASVSGFSLPGSAKTSGASTPVPNPFASLAKPATGASTSANGLFTPRFASPALSTGSQSIFAASTAAQPASPNIFGHISSGPSSNNQEDTDEEGEEPVGSVEATTPPKRKFGESDAETEEDDVVRPSKQSKGSLLSRMTRAADSGSESEKENKASSLFSQSNGTSTPTNKPFNFFDFSAAGSKTAPPKADTFGGDQTFKPGTPIKFGAAPVTEQKAAPTFSFQPASTSTTPSKPPPTNLFNFGPTTGGSSLLAPAGGLSGLNSAPSSVFSSRAATPLSEADTSAQSAAEDDEEGGKQEQIDLSRLTQDELAANDIVFETEMALAKHHVDKGDGTKDWENFARGPLWILKDKKTGKCFVRIRIASGATPLNYNILPALKSSVIGSSAKQVLASMPKKEGGIGQVFISCKTSDIAKEFSARYNDSLP